MKKILTALLSLTMLFIPINVQAREETSITIEYLGKGIYKETIIEESNISLYSTNTKSGTKTDKYKDSNGNVLYTLSVTGIFTYNGSTSTCTTASASATAPASTWTVIQKTASKSSNKATAKGIFNQHLDGRLIQTKTHTITLTCSSSGVLS